VHDSVTTDGAPGSTCRIDVSALDSPAAVRVYERETDFRISAIPFGGYVKYGRASRRKRTPTIPGRSWSKPRWQRCDSLRRPAMTFFWRGVADPGWFMVRFPKAPSSRSGDGRLRHCGFARSQAAFGRRPDYRHRQRTEPNLGRHRHAELSGANRPLGVENPAGAREFPATVTRCWIRTPASARPAGRRSRAATGGHLAGCRLRRRACR